MAILTAIQRMLGLGTPKPIPAVDVLSVRIAQLIDADIDDCRAIWVENTAQIQEMWPDGPDKIVTDTKRDPEATRRLIQRFISGEGFKTFVYTGDTSEIDAMLVVKNHGTVEELMIWLVKLDPDTTVTRSRFRRSMMRLMYYWFLDARSRGIPGLAGRYPVRGNTSALSFLDEIESKSATLRQAGVPSREIVFPHVHEGSDIRFTWREYRGKTENIIKVFEMGFWKELGLPEPTLPEGNYPDPAITRS